MTPTDQAQRNSQADEEQRDATSAPIRSVDDQYHSDDDDDQAVLDDDASRRPLISPRQTSSSSSNHLPHTLSAHASNAWNTTVATFGVYRDAISTRLNNKSSTRRGKRRSTSDASPASGPASRFHIRNPFLRATIFTLSGLIALVLILIAIESIHLFTWTLSSPPPSAQSRILNEALIVRGPDSLQLLNISDAGIQVRIDGRMGLDPDTALDIWLQEKKRESWWKRKDRNLVEWALNKVGGVRIDVGTLTIEEADWTKPLEERIVDLLPHKNDSKVQRQGSSLQDRPRSHSPQPLLSFDLEPLYIPFPGLLATKSQQSPPLIGDNSTRRAHLTMQPLNLTLLFKPASPAPYIVSVVESFVRKGNATLDIRMASLKVQGLTHKEMRNRGASSGWSIPSLIKLGQSQVINRVKQAVPDMNSPGNDDEPFLNLTRYDFFEIKGKSAARNGDDLSTQGGSLGIKAFAQALNPLGPILRGSVKYRIPFGIFLPVDGSDSNATTTNKANETAKVLLAAVASEPFDLVGQEKIDLVVKGRVVPPPPASGTPGEKNAKASSLSHAASPQMPLSSASDVAVEESPQEAALSGFLSRFLRGEPNTVYVRGGSPFLPNDTASLDPSLPGAGSPDLPSWLSSALSVVDLPISFPGSKVTDLIRNVTLSNLSIKPHPFSDEKLLFSATIRGEMALPGQLKAVDVKINELWPDILVFDGAPPSNGHDGDDDDGGIPDDGGDDDDDDDDDEDDDQFLSHPSSSTSSDPIPPPPSPLPSNAFGRVRPHTWVPATTTLNVTTGTKVLESNLTDVPFTILPGRSKEFRSFTWKLITSGSKGVKTGIQGASRVHIWNSGLGSLEISKLPVEGVFFVGGSKDEED